MLGLVVAIFGLIQLLLGVRLVLPFLGNVPEQVEPLMPLFFQVTDLLIAPFAWLPIPGADRFPGFGAGQLDTSVLPALIGWSLVELVVVTVLRMLGAGRRAARRGDGWHAA